MNLNAGCPAVVLSIQKTSKQLFSACAEEFGTSSRLLLVPDSSGREALYPYQAGVAMNERSDLIAPAADAARLDRKRTRIFVRVLVLEKPCVRIRAYRRTCSIAAARSKCKLVLVLILVLLSQFASAKSARTQTVLVRVKYYNNTGDSTLAVKLLLDHDD
eukprot:scaffold6130_cov33-Prasinocladus_malaysianus.AAC.1